MWWIYSQEGACLGKVFNKGKSPPSVQIGRRDDNPHFEEMMATLQPFSEGRVELDHSVIFLGIDLEKAPFVIAPVDMNQNVIPVTT